MTTVEILREARTLIGRGWAQGLRRNGAHCAGSAIDSVAIDDHGGWAAARSMLCRAAHIADALHRWNDAPGRTQAEVLAAFDKAIALAEDEAARSAPEESSRSLP